MTLILFALAAIVAMFAVVFLYGVLRSVLRGLKWLLVVIFTGKRPVKKATPVSTARPYRRDYSYILDSTPSPMNPYFSDVLDAEAAGWSFEYGGYIDDPATYRRRGY